MSATDLQECEGEISVVVGDKRSILVMNGEVSDERDGVHCHDQPPAPGSVQGVGTRSSAADA